MSITPDSAAGDAKVNVASHFLNFPSMATEAFTKNLTSLSSGVTLKTGTWSWARLTDFSTSSGSGPEETLQPDGTVPLREHSKFTIGSEKVFLLRCFRRLCP